MTKDKNILIDLSTTLANYGFEGRPPEITYWTHNECTRYYSKLLGIKPTDFPDNESLTVEKICAITHTGTHMDAPWHFGRFSEGNKAKTIDEIPLEWCYGDGVLLDLRHKKKDESITKRDLEKALNNINYFLKPGDIVLLMVLGGDKYLKDVNYSSSHPGLTGDAVLWVLEQGVKMIGTDAYSLDKPFKTMAKECNEGSKNALWPAHFVGRIKEYCHIEKLANLDKLPSPYNFKIVAFPIKIAAASAGWVRVVAIINE